MSNCFVIAAKLGFAVKIEVLLNYTADADDVEGKRMKNSIIEVKNATFAIELYRLEWKFLRVIEH